MKAGSLEETLKRLGLKLPPAPKPAGVYQPVVCSGGFAFLSGQISRDAGGKLVTGKVGRDLTLEEGKKAAQFAVLQAVSLIQGAIGIERLERVVRLTGYVQSAGDFYAQSGVVDGASELLMEIFGEQGRHARSAVGVSSLPLNAAVELELTLRLNP